MTMLSEEERADEREAVEDTFTMLAVLERNTETGTNPDGSSKAAVWEADPEATPCYLWSRASRSVQGGAERVGPVTIVRFQDLMMTVPFDTDVDETIRVHGVTQDGETVNANILEVRLLIPRPTHKLLVLEQQARKTVAG
jgi:hypothetical protein